MLILIIITLMLAERHPKSYGSGFDAYSSCYRASRQRQQLPCDFTNQNWCGNPGSSYPWHAVRRFVHENQGLMKRMYGEERHMEVLRAELDTNEIEYFHDVVNKEEARERYSKTMTSLASSLISPGQRTVKSVKTKKAISNIGLNNAIGKNSLGDSRKPFTDLSKSTPLLTLKPHTTHSTTTTTAPKPATSPKTEASSTATTAVTKETTTIPTPTKATEATVQTAIPKTDVSEPADMYPETTILPNETQTDAITETDFLVPTTVDGPEVDATTEEDLGEEASYAEQDNYEDSVEDVEEENASEDTENPPPKSPPILRLKGINACPVKEEVVAPFWANNTRGEVLALLNLYPFEQYVHWEKCSYEHKQMFCREGCRCEQQYRLHRLLAYDPNNECRGIFSDWFRFPSCCVCKCYDVPMELRLTSRSPRSPTLLKKEPRST